MKTGVFFITLMGLVAGCVSHRKVSVGKDHQLVESSFGLLFGHEGIIWPLQGRLTSGFGERWGKPHEGIDISAPMGTNIFAVARGVVTFAGYQKGFGKTVIISHRGFRSLYAHCNRVRVKKGHQVRRGQTIATVGRSGAVTGVHLHFEWQTAKGTPLDPLRFLSPRKGMSLSMLGKPNSHFSFYGDTAL